MSYILFISKDGIKLIDGSGLVNPQNGAALVKFGKEVANGSAPIVGGIPDAQLFGELLLDAANANVNAYTRDSFGAVLGTLAGIFTLPLGPAAALIADQAMSEAFKKGYEKAGDWSKNHDWSPFFDWIDGLFTPQASLINPKTLLPTTVISPILGTTPDPLVKTIHYRFVDPLVLDLDGDGLEITPLATGILFDANGDAIKTATAWVGTGDGLLAWDRDGNGTIDSGRELFGDETLLADGTKAAHGFAALAALDTGSVVGGVTVGAGDGVFDARDAAYSAVRVWTDANQDGLSQADELHTLADSGVAAITLASTAPNTNYGDAVLVRSGGFTRADGSAGQAGSFILAQNNFVREFAPIAPIACREFERLNRDNKGSPRVGRLMKAAIRRACINRRSRQRIAA